MNHPSQTPLGYSWGVYASKWRDGDLDHAGGVRRFHVCPSCLDPRDRFDVIVQQVPQQENLRPRCYRCGIALGMATL